MPLGKTHFAAIFRSALFKYELDEFNSEFGGIRGDIIRNYGRNLLENFAALGSTVVVAAEPLEHHAGRRTLVVARRVPRAERLVQRVVLGNLAGVGRTEETDGRHVDSGREVEYRLPRQDRHRHVSRYVSGLP